MTPEEIKAALQATLAEFKAANDKALAEAQAHGKTSADTAEKVTKLNASIDELKDQLNTMAKNVGDKIAALAVGGGGGSGADPKAKARQLKAFNAAIGKSLSADQVDSYANAFGEYLRTGEKNALTPDVRAALSVGYEQGGGVWVPPDTSGPMVKKIYETSPMRQVATVVTISSDAYEGMVDNDEATTGWTSETGTRQETKTPEVGKYRIETFEQYAKPKITQQLLDDANIDVAGWLGDKVAEKLGRTENTAFVVGNGSGKPRGFLDYSKVATRTKWDQIGYVPTGAAGAFLTPSGTASPADAIIDLMTSIKAAYRQGAVFMATRKTIAAIRKLKDGQGNYMVGNTFSQGAFVETLFGFPLIEAPDMPEIAANSFSLAFGNFKAAYIIVDRAGIKVLIDPYTDKPYVQFYTTKRTGGGLINGEAIAVLKFATT